MLKLLKPKTGENVREEDEDDLENETRSFNTPTKSARINSAENNDSFTSRNSAKTKTPHITDFLMLKKSSI